VIPPWVLDLNPPKERAKGGGGLLLDAPRGATGGTWTLLVKVGGNLVANEHLLELAEDLFTFRQRDPKRRQRWCIPCEVDNLVAVFAAIVCRDHELKLDVHRHSFRSARNA
jgi:hypothetical protein